MGRRARAQARENSVTKADGFYTEDGQRIVRTVTEWPAGAERPVTMHIVAPGTVDCDIVEFLGEANRPVSAHALIEALHKSKATVNRALNRLMENGLVERLGARKGPGIAYRLAPGAREGGRCFIPLTGVRPPLRPRSSGLCVGACLRVRPFSCGEL